MQFRLSLSLSLFFNPKAFHGSDFRDARDHLKEIIKERIAQVMGCEKNRKRFLRKGSVRPEGGVDVNRLKTLKMRMQVDRTEVLGDKGQNLERTFDELREVVAGRSKSVGKPITSPCS